MKAYLTEKAGPPSEALKLSSDVDKPVAADNEVVVATKSISINPVDYKVRTNNELIDVFISKDRPVILGWDVSGIVDEVGSGVDTFKVGDKVFGMINFPGHGKGYAEYVAAPADQLCIMPSSTSYEDAAATTLAALTALQAMQTRVKPGDKVLIHAGSGGVGHFAIQIAKSLGASPIIVTSSAKNKDFCMLLGADEHVDYRSVKFEDVVKDADFVLDGMGGETLERSLRVIKDGGKIVTLPNDNFNDDAKKYAEEHDIGMEWILVKSNGTDMKTLAKMMESGKLKPHVSKTYEFEEMAQAHEQLESGRTVGKVVVNV